MDNRPNETTWTRLAYCGVQVIELIGVGDDYFEAVAIQKICKQFGYTVTGFTRLTGEGNCPRGLMVFTEHFDLVCIEGITSSTQGIAIFKGYHDRPVSTPGCPECNHAFYTWGRSLWNTIDHYRRINRNPLVFVGHSAGGAISEWLAADNFGTVETINSAHVLTCGSPALGGTAMRPKAQLHHRLAFNLVDDPVPGLPFVPIAMIQDTNAAFWVGFYTFDWVPVPPTRVLDKSGNVVGEHYGDRLIRACQVTFNEFVTGDYGLTENHHNVTNYIRALRDRYETLLGREPQPFSAALEERLPDIDSIEYNPPITGRKPAVPIGGQWFRLRAGTQGGNVMSAFLPRSELPHAVTLGFNAYAVAWQGMVVANTVSLSRAKTLAKRWRQMLIRLQVEKSVSPEFLPAALTEYLIKAMALGGGFTPVMQSTT